MTRLRSLLLVGIAAVALVATGTASAQQSQFGPADAKEVYYWVSNKANLPLFARYDYVGMKRIAEGLGVQVRVAGPPTSTSRASSPRSSRSARKNPPASRSSAAGTRR